MRQTGRLKKKMQLMAILNCTPDSFYDGGRYFDQEAAIARGLEMVDEGADILDIGGESTRPGAEWVSVDEELRRVIPVIQGLQKHAISIDTCKPEVAEAALEAGATFINDITGFTQPRMRQIAAEFGMPICVMHMQDSPQSMQKNPHYPRGVIVEIKEWFERQIHQLLADGVDSSQIVLDPGIGFGKTVEQNLEILSNLVAFQKLGFPLLLGLSRKSFMSKLINKRSTELLSTSLALNTMCMLEGVSIVRVHDVKEHRDMVDIIEKLDRCCFTCTT